MLPWFLLPLFFLSFLEVASLLIYGDNGCGKTNVLEAISLLSQGRGLRKAKVEDYLCHNELIEGNTKFWGVNAEYTSPEGKINIGTGSRENLQSKSRVVRINFENSSPKVNYF